MEQGLHILSTAGSYTMAEPVCENIFKEKNLLSRKSTPMHMPKKTIAQGCTKTYTQMFVAMLFTIAKQKKQPKCPPIGEWIEKMIYIVQWHCSAMRNKYYYMDEPRKRLLSEVSQEQTTYDCVSMKCPEQAVPQAGGRLGAAGEPGTASLSAAQLLSGAGGMISPSLGCASHNTPSLGRLRWD